MKKIYSLVICFLLLIVSISTIAQPGWTIYNSTNSALTSGTYRAIAIDQTGNIWAGGSYSGLFKFSSNTWTGYNSTSSNLLHDDIQDILVDNSNNIWTANYKGVSVFNGSTFTNYDTANASFDGSTVYALGKDNNGVIWLSSVNGSFGYQGITTFDGSTWNNLTGYPSQVAGGEFSDFAFNSGNETWIASGTGITKFGSTFTFYPKAVTGLWSSSCVAIDGSSNMWAGGFDGILKYTGSTWTMYENVADLGLTSNTLYYDICVDGNLLWIGTSSGLLKFDRNSGTILANYNASNSPLTNNCVTKIVKDVNGNIWMATTIGIVKLDPTLVAVKELTNADAFQIFPNPSEGSFNFTFKTGTNADYKIYSVDGAFIKSGKMTSNKSQVSLSDSPDGIYFIHITNESSINQIVKLIKF